MPSNVSFEAAAAELANARLQGRLAVTEHLQEPGDVREAERIRDLAADKISASLNTTTIGWKIGCTSDQAMAALGASEPFGGALFDVLSHGNGATIPVRANGINVVEPEFAFRLSKPLPCRDEDYREDEVAAAVATVHPAIEVVDPRIPGGFSAPLNWLIADGGVSHAFVCAAGSSDWSGELLAAQSVVLSKNGTVVSEGTGAAAYGGPLRALTWLANHLSGRGRGLAGGETVTTGLVTQIVSGVPGDLFEADFGSFGRVSLTLSL